MATEEAKAAYKLRKQLVEPVFGVVKEQIRRRRLHGRLPARGSMVPQLWGTLLRWVGHTPRPPSTHTVVR